VHQPARVDVRQRLRERSADRDDLTRRQPPAGREQRRQAAALGELEHEHEPVSARDDAPEPDDVVVPHAGKQRRLARQRVGRPDAAQSLQGDQVAARLLAGLPDLARAAEPEQFEDVVAGKREFIHPAIPQHPDRSHPQLSTAPHPAPLRVITKEFRCHSDGIPS
jgi:hypothetical protein